MCEIEELEKLHRFYRTLADFHQKQACNKDFTNDRDFHLHKMKHYDDLLEQTTQKITALYIKQKTNKNHELTRSKNHLP
jgi:hypothetical protein